MYSDGHTPIEQLVLPLVCLLSTCPALWSVDMSTFLCLMLAPVTCSGTMRCQN